LPAATRRGALAYLLIAAGGCATTAPNIESSEALAGVSANQSIVTGRIEWLEDGQKKKIGSSVFTMSLAPNLVRLEDNSRRIAEVNEGGRFVWSLEPGTYLVNKIAYRDPWSGNYFVVPRVAFAVPESGNTYYIGVLESRFAPERDLIGGLSGTVAIRILDEREADVPYLQNSLGITADEVETSLMVHDSRLPQTVDTTPEFNLAVSLINALLYGASQ
jgi:hypothetical protein